MFLDKRRKASWCPYFWWPGNTRSITHISWRGPGCQFGEFVKLDTYKVLAFLTCFANSPTSYRPRVSPECQNRRHGQGTPFGACCFKLLNFWTHLRFRTALKLANRPTPLMIPKLRPHVLIVCHILGTHGAMWQVFSLAKVLEWRIGQSMFRWSCVQPQVKAEKKKRKPLKFCTPSLTTILRR